VNYVWYDQSDRQEGTLETQSNAQPGGDSRPRRRRPATGYPVIDLGDAASVLVRASQHGWEHTVAEIAGYMGHATVNSGAFRAKLAALRDYGLVSGRGESLEITAVGRKIAIPETDAERYTAMQEAFANTVFDGLYQESVKGQPIAIESIGRRAVSKLGVAPSSQRSFGETFARSAAAAGLAETTGDGKVTLFSKPQAGSSNADHVSPLVGTSSVDASPAVQLQAARGSIKPVLDQRWPLPDGEVALIVTIDRPLSATDFSSIGAVVGEIERLVAGLTRGDASA
jgi:hypothetical protein